MCELDPYVRLSALDNGETKCVIFVDSVERARKELSKFSSSILYSFPFISGFGAVVNVYTLDDLSRQPCVKAISSHTTVTTCAFPATENTGAEELFSRGYYGGNISVAVIDTGVRPHLDFMIPRKRVEFADFVNGKAEPYDDNGHGTAVASILCGNGLVSGGVYRGIAPKANLISLKAIGKNGEGGAFSILEAMQWCYTNCEKYNIKVICMSFGSDPVEGTDPLAVGAEALYKRGITVVASAGNDGPESATIKSPGISPYIITVGGAEFSDGEIKVPDFSSRGPAGAYDKPDIIAPSVDIACCGTDKHYISLSGTSMAAPIVAGAAALILSANPEFTPDRVKELLLNNAAPVNADIYSAGRGLLDLRFINENL